MIYQVIFRDSRASPCFSTEEKAEEFGKKWQAKGFEYLVIRVLVDVEVDVSRFAGGGYDR